MSGFLTGTRGGFGVEDCRRAAGVFRSRQLTAAGLPRGDARLILPSCSPLLQPRDFGQLLKRRATQVRQPEQDRFDAGKTEIAGFQRRSGTAQPAVKAKNGWYG